MLYSIIIKHWVFDDFCGFFGGNEAKKAPPEGAGRRCFVVKQIIKIWLKGCVRFGADLK
jgi:hypothetical protein